MNPRFSSIYIFIVCVLLLSSFSTGCSNLPQYPDETLREIRQHDDTTDRCRTALAVIENSVSRSNRADAGEEKIKQFPYLRTNRFLAALSRLNLTDSQQWQLFELLERNANFSLKTETRNLPPEQVQRLPTEIHPLFQDSSLFQDSNLEEIINYCTQHLKQTELQSPIIADYVRKQIHVDDHYKTWQRVVGLYYLTVFPVLIGVHNWHNETLKVFNSPVSELPVTGKLKRYILEPNQPSLSRQEAAAILLDSRDNPLQIPLPEDHQLKRLFNHFAPVFEIDTALHDDQIGQPYWDSSGAARPEISIKNPAIYTKLSHAVFNREVLLQLNYMIWFPARPCQSTFDILCGHIDGLIWRVTLTNDGMPLLFDSIHSCGCYHQFFPSPALKLQDDKNWLQEPVLVPRRLPWLKHNEKITVRVASITHYINSVTIEADSGSPGENTVTLPGQQYDLLRSISVNETENRSMFDNTGLVPGTQRGERFILWPMGVASPGAMRQWGTHATAFVGRRHFDEPCLIDDIFIQEEKYQAPRHVNRAQDNILYLDMCKNQ